MTLKSNLNYLFFLIIFLSLWLSAKAVNEYSSYRRYPLCKACQNTRYPETVDDVVKIVQDAITKKLTVKAFGSRHSQTDIICTQGIPVDMRKFQSKVMNADNTATIGAGVVLRDATEFLRLNGRALRTTPAYGNITIGGAIGTGAHGSTIKFHASISSQVVGMKIVDGKGDIRIITDPDDLKAFKIHLGLLGIVVEVTLNTVELYKTLAYNYAVSDDILTNGDVVKYARETDQMSVYWFPAFNEVVISNWTIVDVSTPGTSTTYDHVPSVYSNFALISSLAKEIAFSLTESKCAAANLLGYVMLHVFEYFLELALIMPLPDWVPIYANENGNFENPTVGYYDLMFAPVCYDEPQGILGSACPWSHGTNSITILDNEFSLDLDRLGDFVKAVKAIILKTPTAFPLQGILIRFSDKSDIYMSTAYGRQTAHFEFYLWERDDFYNRSSGSLAGYQTILQTLTQEFNGRSHWGKSGLVYHNSTSLDCKLDETARQNFISVMNKYDPNEVFINNFGLRLKRKGTDIDMDPLTTHCALLDNCICTKDSHCGDNQICTKLPGYSYNVCRTKNEIAPVDLFKVKLPTPFGVVSYLTTIVPTLIPAIISNCSLTDGIGTLGGLLLGGLNPIEKILQTVGTLSSQLSNLGTLEGIVGVVDDILEGVLSD